MFKDTDFRTAQACSTGGVFNCVAVAVTHEVVGVRDTKDARKNTLQYSPEEWRTFVAAVKRGEFDI